LEFVAPIVVILLLLLVVLKLSNVILALLRSFLYKFVFQLHPWTRQFGAKISETTRKRGEKIAKRQISYVLVLMAIVAWMGLRDVPLFSFQGLSTRNAMFALTRLIPVLGMIFLIYVIFLSVYGSVITIREIGKHKFDKKGVEVFTLTGYFYGIIHTLVMIAIIVTSFLVFSDVCSKLHPIAMRSSFLLLGINDTTPFSIINDRNLISIVGTFVRLLLRSLTPYILFSYIAMFICMPLSYLYFRGRKYVLFVTITLIVGITLSGAMVRLAKWVLGEAHWILLSSCIVMTLFATNLFLTLLRNLFGEQK
jgi:hypothetical protein